MSIPIQARRYAAHGLSVAADVGGDPGRPAVILLHGGGQTRHSWHGAMQELLAAGYHVVNLDARGHGDSDWAPDGVYSLESMSLDLMAVIATLPSRPALVGASMGGMAALYTAGQADVAKALVLVDVVPRVDPVGAAKIGEFMNANQDGFATLEEAADAVTAYNPHRPRPKDIGGLMKNLRQRENGRLYWHWDPRFITREARSAEPPQFAEVLLEAAGKVKIPVMVVRGNNSDIVNDEGIAELRRHVPQLEVFDVAGAGHMVAGDKNDAFNHGVISFLQRNLPAT